MLKLYIYWVQERYCNKIIFIIDMLNIQQYKYYMYLGYDSLCFDSGDDFYIGFQNVSHKDNHIPLTYDVTSGFKQVYLLYCITLFVCKAW